MLARRGATHGEQRGEGRQEVGERDPDAVLALHVPQLMSYHCLPERIAKNWWEADAHFWFKSNNLVSLFMRRNKIWFKKRKEIVPDLQFFWTQKLYQRAVNHDEGSFPLHFQTKSQAARVAAFITFTLWKFERTCMAMV